MGDNVRLTLEEIGLIGCEYQKGILETGEIGNFGKAVAQAQEKKLMEYIIESRRKWEEKRTKAD